MAFRNHQAIEMAKPVGRFAGLDSSAFNNDEKLGYSSTTGLPITLEHMLSAFNAERLKFRGWALSTSEQLPLRFSYALDGPITIKVFRCNATHSWRPAGGNTRTDTIEIVRMDGSPFVQPIGSISKVLIGIPKKSLKLPTKCLQIFIRPKKGLRF